MKSITCFTESLGGGGAEHQMVILAGMLKEKGYDVNLVTYASLPDHYDTPIGVHRLEVGKTGFKGRRIKAFIKALKVFHFFFWHDTDCIISYRESANLRVLIPMLFRSRKKVKVICSDRNTSVVITRKHWLLLNFLYKRADYIVPNSKTQTEIIASYKPQLRKKLITIHNYTDLHQFVESKVPEDMSVFRIAVFSRFSAQKNPLGFAEALKMLKEKTSYKFQVHWYGSQSGDINGYCKEYLSLNDKIDNLGIRQEFILHPAVKNPATEMNYYHAVSLPSIYEGFSNSIAEAICCGKPMLVSDVSDNSLMVHDGENGFLFDPKDIDSICHAFLSLFDLNYEEMSKMGKRSREIAESLFDKESFIKKYIDLIES